MSLPSTPARSRCASRASSLSSVRNGRESIRELTPRSKVKAMLAAIDDESGDDVNDHALTSAVVDVSKSLKTNSPAESHDDETQADDESEPNNEEEIPVPRGRMAARLRGLGSTGRPRESANEEETANAYDRVKQHLLQKTGESRVDSPVALSRHNSDEDNLLSKSFQQRRARPVALDFDDTESPERSSALPRLSKASRLTPGQGTASPSAPHEATSKSDGSDSGLLSDPQANSRFLALVARKRQERLAKETEIAKRKADKKAAVKTLAQSKRTSARQRTSSTISSGAESEEDIAAGKRLTQQARPTRKASKKALEEMNRETQRMSRNMQLAHQAKTKKKITKDSFLERFKSGTGSSSSLAPFSPQRNLSTTASSAPVSDVEVSMSQQTPPTSPPTYPESIPKAPKADLGTISATEGAIAEPVFIEEELPSLEDAMAESVLALEKGKGKATRELTPKPPSPQLKNRGKTSNQSTVRVRPTELYKTPKLPNIESDSDLEILPHKSPKPRKADLFDRAPRENLPERRSLMKLRALAHLASPAKLKAGNRISVSQSDMQMSLQRRARQQAAKERAEKIQELRDRGVILQTAEERERDQAEVEDLLERARQKAEEITKEEKQAAKKERREKGEDSGLDDTSEDEDYHENNVTEPDIELSGSDDEEELNEGEDEEGEESGMEGGIDGGVPIGEDLIEHQNLFDQEASEENYYETEASIDDADDEQELPTLRIGRKGKSNRVVHDDTDEEDVGTKSNMSPPGGGSAKKPLIPNLPKSDGDPLGLTQAFAATMADTQTQSDGNAVGLEQGLDLVSFQRDVSELDLPLVDPDEPETLVRDSQTAVENSGNGNSYDHVAVPDIDHLSQSQIEDSDLDRFLPPTATQLSQLPDPTQDAGFVNEQPMMSRFSSIPPSTVATVILPEAAAEQLSRNKKKGRLRRRNERVTSVHSDADDVISNADEDQLDIAADAFDVLRLAAKKPKPAPSAFDKKKSEAKGMVQEQAEESEDEYAGLGGASGNESEGDENDEDKEMVDDSEINVDERELAALVANKERDSDEKAVKKLLADIEHGGLRRKRGAEFDLSDSDDDGEARRRMRQREFQKMRKALLADEKVGQIAEDPKKLAFLRAIEDHGEDDDHFDFLRPDDPSQTMAEAIQEDSQSQPAPQEPEPTTSKRKRPLEESFPDAANRPPAQARRTQKPKKPSTLAEIREHVSYLIETPNDFPQDLHVASSDDENPDENHILPLSDEADHPSHDNPRRTTVTNPSVIDRMSLKRAESTSAASSRLAFHNPTATSSSFHVPSLLRRATTQLADTNNHGVTTAAETERATGDADGPLRKKGSKKCSVNYLGRLVEKRRGVVDVERRRREGVKRKRGERGVVLGGLVGGGGFD